MNSALFLTDRNKLWLYILGPLLVLSLVYFSATAYFKVRRSALEERRELVRLMPVMLEKISAAENMLKDYRGEPAANGGVIELLNTQFSQAAEGSNFTIDLLIVEKQPPAGSTDQATAFKVKLRGAGSLAAIAGMLSRLSAIDKLFVLDEAGLRAEDVGPEPYYHTDLLFYYYRL